MVIIERYSPYRSVSSVDINERDKGLWSLLKGTGTVSKVVINERDKG